MKLTHYDDTKRAHASQIVRANECVLMIQHSGKSATIRDSNHGSVYVRSIMRSTMYMYYFCSPKMAQ